VSSGLSTLKGSVKRERKKEEEEKIREGACDDDNDYGFI